MGCNASKLDRADEMPAGLRPFRSRIEEIKQRRRRTRNVSIVSTAELLRPEEREDNVAVDIVVGTELNEEEMEDVGVEEQKERTVTETIIKELGEDTKKNNKIYMKDLEEELHGSPSFRVYFTSATARDSSDDSDVNIIQKIKNGKLAKAKQEQERSGTHKRRESSEFLASNASIEEMEIKPLRKDRGKRFKVLTKAPSRMYSFLTVRNCYNHDSSGAANDSPRLISEKAA